MRIGETIYLFEDKNINLLKKDIDKINELLIYFSNENEILIGTQVPINELIFTTENYGKGRYDFCRIILNLYTKTAKLSKYPIRVYIETIPNTKETSWYNEKTKQMEFDLDGISADIDYLANGEIGKARVIYRKGEKNFSVRFKNVNKQPEIAQLNFFQ